jgi:hypothetical protein
MISLSFVCAFLFIVRVQLVDADLFTAMADMEGLLGAEKEVGAVINEYIDSEMKRLENIKRYGH